MKTPNDVAQVLGIARQKLEEVAALGKGMYFFKKMRKGGKARTLRCAKEPLSGIQKAIKRKILDRLPLPPTMHGWRKHHSAKTYAAGHTRQKVVLNYDIKDFFPCVTASRVFAFWESVGFDRNAAKLLTCLTVCDNQLPQGTCTSPSIGNQILRGLDCRLRGLAVQHAISYGNLADEVAISGRQRVKRLNGLVVRIINQEEFVVNPSKIKVRERHQRQELAGIVVNKKLSLGRRRYRLLKAIIHNCVLHGPESQNRERLPHFREHLRGRIAQLRHVSPRLGKRLLQDFEKISWTVG